MLNILNQSVKITPLALPDLAHTSSVNSSISLQAALINRYVRLLKYVRKIKHFEVEHYRTIFELISKRTRIYSKTHIQKRVVQQAQCIEFTPEKQKLKGTILYVHGGGFAFGSTLTHHNLMRELALATNCRVVGVEYPLAPEFPYPAALNKLEEVAVLYTQLYSGGPIILAGESAGGGLVCSLIQRLKKKKISVHAAVLYSPWVDLKSSYLSYERNKELDGILLPTDLKEYAGYYASDLSNEEVSPIFSDFSHFPPTLLQISSNEILCDQVYELHKTLMNQGVNSKLEVYHELFHAWQLFAPFLPDATLAIQQTALFLDENLKESFK